MDVARPKAAPASRTSRRRHGPDRSLIGRWRRRSPRRRRRIGGLSDDRDFGTRGRWFGCSAVGRRWLPDAATAHHALDRRWHRAAALIPGADGSRGRNSRWRGRRVRLAARNHPDAVATDERRGWLHHHATAQPIAAAHPGRRRLPGSGLTDKSWTGRWRRTLTGRRVGRPTGSCESRGVGRVRGRAGRHCPGVAPRRDRDGLCRQGNYLRRSSSQHDGNIDGDGEAEQGSEPDRFGYSHDADLAGHVPDMRGTLASPFRQASRRCRPSKKWWTWMKVAGCGPCQCQAQNRHPKRQSAGAAPRQRHFEAARRGTVPFTDAATESLDSGRQNDLALFAFVPGLG